MFFFSVIPLQVTYSRDGSYKILIDGTEHTVQGHLQEQAGKIMVVCNIDGTESRANVVINGDSLHVFSMVCMNGFLAC